MGSRRPASCPCTSGTTRVARTSRSATRTAIRASTTWRRSITESTWRRSRSSLWRVRISCSSGASTRIREPSTRSTWPSVCGLPLLVAGIVQDQRYFEEQMRPRIDGDDVRFVGAVGPAERSKLLGGARALLHLIDFDEPFGFSVVEAMACGTPVIAFRRGSMPELIEHGVTGFLVDDVDAAVAAVGQAVAARPCCDPSRGRSAVRTRPHGGRVPRRLRSSDLDATSEPDTFRLGVNYWPAAQAMDWLQRYDSGITRRDFVRAKSAGFDTIRVFLRWEDAQPTSSTIDRAIIARLVDAADAAVEVAATLLVTLFVGHMSGVNWVPRWAVGGIGGDPTLPNPLRRKSIAGRDGHSQLVRGLRGRRCSGTAGGRHSRCACRPPRRLGLGPGKRELELHASSRSGRRGSMARTHVDRAQTQRPWATDHDRPPHGRPRE